MPLAAVEGQPRAIDALRSALRSGALHHAWLFAGPEGVGKELTAVSFAQALTCPVTPGEGCGECTSCGRIERRNHPDVGWVMPDPEAPSRMIKVDQVRGLEERLSRRPLEAERHIAILAPADLMNESAQNAFLKTLEEPPPGTVLILVASSPDKLLPTIRSRCTRVQFVPLPDALVAKKVREARGMDEPTSALVATMSHGSLSRALDYDAEMLARRRELIERFEALDPNDARTWLAFAEAYGGARENVEETLEAIDRWTRDVAIVRAGGERIANADLLELARRAAGRVSDAALQRRHRLIAEAQEEMRERNASPRLQLEKVIVQGARVSAA